MSKDGSSPEALAERIANAATTLPPQQNRHLVAVAGPPGAGKSTVTALAQAELNRRGHPTGLLSMDGFHYDNAILTALDMLHRKGAPETFDVAGFHALLLRLQTEDAVAVPEFDRDLDKAIAARSIVTQDQRIVLVEGNYLLLDEPGWVELQSLWSVRVFLDVDLQTLETRLTDRWLSHGLPADAARDRALANDIPNARRVVTHSLPGDVVLG